MTGPIRNVSNPTGLRAVCDGDRTTTLTESKPESWCFGTHSLNHHALMIWFTTVLAGMLSMAVMADAAEKDVLVGVNYFAGWWEMKPNKWHHGDVDWRPLYPDRRPLLGEYNTQATMDREIVAAAEHGISFFQILWYGADAQRENEPLLNRGVEQFMKSPHAGRLKFMIEYCNHPPFGITSLERWRKDVAYWVKCMQHPSYLRVGGRPVFQIHGGGQFFEQVGGTEGVDRFLGILRGAAREAGLGELIIGCGGNGPDPFRDDHWMLKRLDYNNEYMAVPSIERTEADLPYAMLAQHHAAWRAGHTNDTIPTVPTIPAGWNPRPWQDDKRPCFAFPTRAEWTDTLRQLKADLEKGVFGFPLPNGGVQPAFTIYAWNEFGEGGIVAPTKGSGYMMLECIRDVFVPKTKEQSR